MKKQYCPLCRSVTMRSRSHNRSEKLARKVTMFSPLECLSCPWRGWARSPRKVKRWRKAVAIILLGFLLSSIAYLSINNVGQSRGQLAQALRRSAGGS